MDDFNNWEPQQQSSGGEFQQWKFFAFLLGAILFLILAGWIWWNFDKYYGLAFVIGTGALLAYYFGQRQAMGIVRMTMHEFVDAQHATGQTATGMFKVMSQMINFKKMMAAEEKKSSADKSFEVVPPEPWEIPSSEPAAYLDAVDTGNQSNAGPTYYG